MPVVLGIAALNAFLPFFPIELFLILRILVRPKEWWRVSLLSAAASAFGALLLALLLEQQPHGGLVNWFVHWLGQVRWDQVSQLVRDRGSFGLVLISISFLPLPPAVVMCVVSKVPATEIALAIGLGNFLKYSFFSYLAARSPLLFADVETDRIS